MYIIKTRSDIKKLETGGKFTPELAKHFTTKINELRQEMAPEIRLDDFNLETYGSIGLLEAGDKDFTAMGLPECFDYITPEFISRIEIEGKIYYILYIMPDNDYFDEIYLPETSMTVEIREWILDQPIEEEELATIS